MEAYSMAIEWTYKWEMWIVNVGGLVLNLRWIADLGAWRLVGAPPYIKAMILETKERDGAQAKAEALSRVFWALALPGGRGPQE
jgi:hypothetical protein